MPSIAPEIQVVCAVIRRDHQVLIAKRADDVHQGGLWEFPGGKCQPSETHAEALSRELEEELGIVPTAIQPVCQIPWDYGSVRVRLWVFEVTAFEGEPSGREGQPIAWVSMDALSGYPFPAANRHIVRSVGLPRVAIFFDPNISGDPQQFVTARAERSLLYFRGLPEGDALGAAIQTAIDRGHCVILNRDQWSMFRPGCGLHLRAQDAVPDALERLPTFAKPWPLTAGIRSEADWVERRPWPADAWFVSPVCQTASHPQAVPIGWTGFGALSAQVGGPTYALGGVQLSDWDPLFAVFGYGLAGIRGFQ